MFLIDKAKDIKYHPLHKIPKSKHVLLITLFAHGVLSDKAFAYNIEPSRGINAISIRSPVTNNLFFF